MEQLPGDIVLYQSVVVIKGYERNTARCDWVIFFIFYFF